MSYQRALDLINLRADCRGHQENLDHPLFMQEILGRDPWPNPYQAYIDTYKALDVDWVIGIPRPHLAANTFTHTSRIDLGDGLSMTEWGLAGSAWREEFHFHSVAQVLAYNPLEELTRSGTTPVAEAASTWQALQADQVNLGQAALLSGIHYVTLFQACIMTFGWPLFLEAAGAEPERFQPILAGFAERTRRYLVTYAGFHPPLVLIHDDIAMQRGLVFQPAWYRQRLLPLYAYLLEPLLADPDIRVCFVSDGDYSLLLPDLAALGFHGFFINPNMDLGQIARQYGRDHFLVGNVDTAVLTFGDPEAVRKEVQRCCREAAPCAGHFIKAMGDMPHNIPLANMRAYFKASRVQEGISS
ncbi:MAG: uroporphyrinogen decarboxylase family protein [Anaerolineae bacterium]